MIVAAVAAQVALGGELEDEVWPLDTIVNRAAAINRPVPGEMRVGEFGPNFGQPGPAAGRIEQAHPEHDRVEQQLLLRRAPIGHLGAFERRDRAVFAGAGPHFTRAVGDHRGRARLVVEGIDDGEAGLEVGVEGGDGGAAGRVRGGFDTEERGGEIAATGHDRHVHGEVVTAELPGPLLIGRRLAEEGEPVVVGTPLQAGRIRRLGQHGFGLDHAADGGVSVGAQGRR